MLTLDYLEDDYVEDAEEWWDEDRDLDDDLPPPLGTLSRGPVWELCPDLRYDQWQGSLHLVLSYLDPSECEELAEFLCSLEVVCPVPECTRFSPEACREELIRTLLNKRAFKAAHRQRNRMPDPEALDETLRLGRVWAPWINNTVYCQ